MTLREPLPQTRRQEQLLLPITHKKVLSLVGLAAKRPHEVGDLAAQLPLAPPLLLAGEALPARLQQLVAPAVVERLRHRLLAAHLPDAAVAAQPRQD
jgi:hypothetical protein